ncbi:MAG: heme o synthase [Acidobacteriota bacterium]|nr:heme o synthase [Acidobacteriota bacterium]
MSHEVGWSDLSELTKPRITLMVLITMAAGAFLAAPMAVPSLAVLEAIVATGILASCASALNQVIEVRQDARMDRTADRPIAAGRVDRGLVLVVCSVLTVLSVLLLAWRVNPLAAALGAATSFSYLFLYTPLKTKTPISTLVGAVPGALPPVIGWAAAAGRLDLGAWVLFGIVFFWQIPHFLAIGWMHREDYERGGFPILPVLDRTGGRTSFWMLITSVMLVLLTAVSPSLGFGGTIFLVGSTVAGLAFLWTSVGFARDRSKSAARRVLLGSVLYIPVVFGLSLLEHVPGLGG